MSVRIISIHLVALQLSKKNVKWGRGVNPTPPKKKNRKATNKKKTQGVQIKFDFVILELNQYLFTIRYFIGCIF